MLAPPAARCALNRRPATTSPGRHPHDRHHAGGPRVHRRHAPRRLPRAGCRRALRLTEAWAPTDGCSTRPSTAPDPPASPRGGRRARALPRRTRSGAPALVDAHHDLRPLRLGVAAPDGTVAVAGTEWPTLGRRRPHRHDRRVSSASSRRSAEHGAVVGVESATAPVSEMIHWPRSERVGSDTRIRPMRAGEADDEGEGRAWAPPGAGADDQGAGRPGGARARWSS